MAFLILRELEGVRALGEYEFLNRLKLSKSFFSDFHQQIIIPAINFWQSSLLPRIYKEFEKIIGRFRIHILKIENLLFKLANYIRGKRKTENNNHQSPYWREINDFKNGLKK